MASKRPTAAQLRVIRDNGPIIVDRVGKRLRVTQSGKPVSPVTARALGHRQWIRCICVDKLDRERYVYEITDAGREAANASH